MPVIVVSVLFLLLSVLASVTATYAESTKNNRLESRKAAQAVVFKEVTRYYRETGTLPTSLSALAAAAGYRHLAAYQAKTTTNGLYPSTVDAVAIARTNALTDTAWSYQRAAVVTLVDRTESLATYLNAANNTCPPASGSADFASTAGWCGDSSGVWGVVDPRAQFNAQTAKALALQEATAEKFARRLKAGIALPLAATATALRVVATATTGSTVGTTAATCSGSFYWGGTPLDCADLYNSFGLPVSYTRPAVNQLLLSSSTTIKNAAGVTQTVSTSKTIV